MSVNAFTEEYEYIELFGKPGLFTNARIDRDTVPEAGTPTICGAATMTQASR